MVNVGVWNVGTFGHCSFTISNPNPYAIDFHLTESSIANAQLHVQNTHGAMILLPSVREAHILAAGSLRSLETRNVEVSFCPTSPGSIQVL
jgi:hypothetical protein